jgi:hypothetical protein
MASSEGQTHERLAHLVAVFVIKPVQPATKPGRLSPGLAQNPAGVLGNGLVERMAFLERSRSERQVKLQLCPLRTAKRAPDHVAGFLPVGTKASPSSANPLSQVL